MAHLTRKDIRKPYRGGKAIDASCRNHGGCPWCEGNRTIQDQKLRESAIDQLAEEMDAALAERPDLYEKLPDGKWRLTPQGREYHNSGAWKEGLEA